MKAVADALSIHALERDLTLLASTVDGADDFLEFVAVRAFYPIVQDIFDTENRGAWLGYTSLRYAREKTRDWGDSPIMQASGNLMLSLTQRGSSFNIHEHSGPGELVMGSSLPYAAPATDVRPVNEFDSGDYEELALAASEYLVNRAHELGFEAEVEEL